VLKNRSNLGSGGEKKGRMKEEISQYQFSSNIGERDIEKEEET